MITNAGVYRSRDDAERLQALRNMTPEESIAVGEALLTSEIMEHADFADDDRPMCLAVALGIRRRYAEIRP
jgi:hypothetical protein